MASQNYPTTHLRTKLLYAKQGLREYHPFFVDGPMNRDVSLYLSMRSLF